MAEQYETETLRAVAAFPFRKPDGSGYVTPGELVEGPTAWIMRKVKDGHVNLNLPEGTEQVRPAQGK